MPIDFLFLTVARDSEVSSGGRRDALPGGTIRQRLRSRSNSSSDRSFVSNNRAYKDRNRGSRNRDNYRARRGRSPSLDKRHYHDPREFHDTDRDRLSHAYRSNYHTRLRRSVSPRESRSHHDSYRVGRLRRSPSISTAAYPGGTVSSAQHNAALDKNQRKGTTMPSSSNLKLSVSESSSSSEDRGENDLTEEQLLRKLLGFAEFDSSKGKYHGSSDLSGVNRKTKRRYRQYMNRKGGFNRPLSPTF
ncbi:hypothetical protein IE077_000155 [Cardiosporidium cionae]|uniref:U4/U6.U5 small nuclear ribonucleoprotein 27kDa protein domain-containing protein n=1 Tax=Cardiosporidium cionae TaxID=476202 RepID=A0ABQ7J5C3_9APIC|nr:hypothetical protein IE077_000155 [Cardiosporidium cionae]|eukprot:KAF8819215.1 hypothetical protein IE077_000155 [Cardiosporidium cionae]